MTPCYSDIAHCEVPGANTNQDHNSELLTKDSQYKYQKLHTLSSAQLEPVLSWTPHYK